MSIFKKILLIIILGIILLVGFFFYKYKAISIPKTVSVAVEEKLPFNIPEGFVMSVFASGVDGARVMELDPKGTMLVSQTSKDKISALIDRNGDGKAEEIVTVIDKLNAPHGISFECSINIVCKLYIAEEDKLSVYEYDDVSKKATNPKKLLDLPKDGGHYTRSIIFLPYPNENILLVSVGSSCNVCNEADSKRASIISYDIKTGKYESFAKGLRNSVFLKLHPIDGKVYATEMGRDGLGDNTPPDEINIIEKSKNYGWPTCYGKNIHDTNFDKNTYIRNPCMEPFETQSLVDLQAHSAPLGLDFVPEEGWEEKDWFSMIVAYHGSWNRSVPTGYKVVKIPMLKDGSYGEPEDFITGWLKEDGTKIAEKMVLELKDKVGMTGDENDVSLRDEIDAVEALKALGYSQNDSRNALQEIDRSITKTGDRIKAALKILGK